MRVFQSGGGGGGVTGVDNQEEGEVFEWAAATAAVQGAHAPMSACYPNRNQLHLIRAMEHLSSDPLN